MFVRYDTKSAILKKKKPDKLDFTKIKNLVLVLKTLLGEWKGRSQNGRLFLQSIHLIKDMYPEYIKDSQKSTLRNQPNIKNWEKI